MKFNIRIQCNNTIISSYSDLCLFCVHACFRQIFCKLLPIIFIFSYSLMTFETFRSSCRPSCIYVVILSLHQNSTRDISPSCVASNIHIIILDSAPSSLITSNFNLARSHSLSYSITIRTQRECNLPFTLQCKPS